MKKKWIYLICSTVIIIIGIAGILLFNFFQPASKPTTKPTIQSPSKQPKIEQEPENKPNEEPVEDVNTLPVETVTKTQKKEIVQLQISQSIQETSYYCVPACVQMALRSFGIEVSQRDLAQKMNTNALTGTEYIDMVKTLNRYLFQKELANDNEPGYHLQKMETQDQNPQIAAYFEQRVKDNINTNYPVFTSVDLHALYPELPNANHMFLVTGYALYENSDKIAYYYGIDPYTAVQDSQYGGLKIFSSAEFIEAMLSSEEPAYLW